MTREGFALLINHQPDLQVCGHAGNPNEALAAIRLAPPDLVVSDLALSGGASIDVVRKIHAVLPDLPIVFLSMHDETLYAERVLKAGARGYVMKQSATCEVLAAIRQVLQGRIYLSPAMSAKVADRHFRGGAEAASGVSHLSNRELEIFRLVGQGMRTCQIAQKLHLSVSTVETYRQHIKRKLGLQNGTELVRHAVAWSEQRG